MLSGYLSTILEAVENVLVETSKRLRPEIKILGDIRIELLVKGRGADEFVEKEHGGDEVWEQNFERVGEKCNDILL